MYYVYALSSRHRNYIYVGLTSNVLRRFYEHNNGYEKTTRAYRPFYLLCSEVYETRIDARKREIYLKSGVGKAFLRNEQSKLNLS